MKKKITKRSRRWAWFIPSFNGDIRLEPNKDDPKKTTLVIFDPTEAEIKSVVGLSAIFVEKKWLDAPIAVDDASATLVEPSGDTSDPFRSRAPKTWSVTINAPLEEVGPVFVTALKPGPAVLTAVKYADGKVETVEHQATGDAAESLKKLAKKKKVTAAATVSRLTPSCPECFVDAISPATEVLLSFLSAEQHKTWMKSRYIVVQGGISGHRYIIAHRNSEIAAKNGRICFDVDDRNVMHFHDQSVPPEEEVLGAMLILQHREQWLRNEATCIFGEHRFTRVFKNPFGDIYDGIPDAQLTNAAGMMGLLKLGMPEHTIEFD